MCLERFSSTFVIYISGYNDDENHGSGDPYNDMNEEIGSNVRQNVSMKLQRESPHERKKKKLELEKLELEIKALKDKQITRRLKNEKLQLEIDELRKKSEQSTTS